MSNVNAPTSIVTVSGGVAEVTQGDIFVWDLDHLEDCPASDLDDARDSLQTMGENNHEDHAWIIGTAWPFLQDCARAAGHELQALSFR